MITYTIYQHIFPNNKQYIGITKREPETRWGPGGYHYKNNPPMWEAIQEFGWDNIQHIILESDVPEEEVSRKERQYIDQYDSANPEKGYNRAAQLIILGLLGHIRGLSLAFVLKIG